MKKFDSAECHIRFGQFIKDARTKQDITQKELAETMGISQAYYSFIERGERDIDLAVAMKLCRCLKIDIRTFIDSYL